MPLAISLDEAVVLGDAEIVLEVTRTVEWGAEGSVADWCADTEGTAEDSRCCDVAEGREDWCGADTVAVGSFSSCRSTSARRGAAVTVCEQKRSSIVISSS